MLGPHLTPDNLIEVLALAKHRTKKELARLVRRLDPLPEVPSRIEPLGPAPSRLLSPAPTWTQSVAALNPIRELEPGARPRDWMEWPQSAVSANDGSSGTRLDDGNALARLDADEPALPRLDAAGHAPAPPARLDADATAAEFARVRLEPQRYKVQFEASEEYVELVERAKALLSHRGARPDLGDLHLRAMRALVAELERERYAVVTRQRVARGSPPELADNISVEVNPSRNPNPSPNPNPNPNPSPKPTRAGAAAHPGGDRRAVFERDAGRCTYRSDSGERCRETARLELHHSIAFAQGGEHRLDNVTLRCRAHNALAAEGDRQGFRQPALADQPA